MKSTDIFICCSCIAVLLFYHTFIRCKHSCRFTNAPQACRKNIAGCCDPGSLVCEADGCKAKSSYKSKTDNCSGDHFCYAGENGSTRISKSLSDHTGDIENTKTPVEKSHTSEIFGRGIQNCHRTLSNKQHRKCTPCKNQ